MLKMEREIVISFDEGVYTAIPIETLDKVKDLLDDASGSLYVGRTEKGLRIIEEIKTELFGEEEEHGD